MKVTRNKTIPMLRVSEPELKAIEKAAKLDDRKTTDFVRATVLKSPVVADLLNKG